jgi:hypothetical protein
MLFFRLTTLLCVSVILPACGTKKKAADDKQSASEDSVPVSTPFPISTPTSQPVVTQTSPSVTVPTATIWVASNALRAVAGYDAKGNFVKLIDLSTYFPSGSISAITFLNKNTMIVTADPGTSGERLMRIDLSDDVGNVAAINANWFQDSVNFTNVAMFKLLKWSNSKIIAVKGNSMIEMLTFNLNNNAVSRTGAPAINNGLTTAANVCNLTTSQYLMTATLSNVTKLIGFSSGAYARANIYGNIDVNPTCDGSFNYIAGTVTAGHIPVGAVQMGDGKVYVRYQFTSNPVIMRYSYDGLTLANATVFFNDSGFLNTTTSDRDLVALDSTSMLFANWQANAIVKLNTSTGVAEFLIRDMFTASANSIAIRPAQ